ncbi:MAG: hypothetical protein JXB62_03475, partial [Pirellulales bacterium]|nr:hypothetical protein [Pirellulales bacterium]
QAEPPWYGPVCPVVWEGSGREAAPYPDCRGFDGGQGPARMADPDRRGIARGLATHRHHRKEAGKSPPFFSSRRPVH